MVFIPSEQLWLKQCVNQIDEQRGGDERSERVIKNHDLISSQLFASVDISDRRGEEADRERDHYDLHHGKLQTKFRKPAAKRKKIPTMTRDMCAWAHRNSRGNEVRPYKNLISAEVSGKNSKT